MTDTAKNNDRKKYVLKVRRGEELSLYRPEEICNKESIMRPSYEKAMRALMRIMCQTKRFHTESEYYDGDVDIYELENRLFSYSGNIIAFAASRGGGKTATMLSFSNILNKGFGRHSADSPVDNSFLNDKKNDKEDQPDAWLSRCTFIPLTPIAPAVLEGDQNILYVVLSRLYRYAERLLSERARSDRVREVQKNEILRSFQSVLSGINGIKRPEKTHPGDLAGMQDVCDGLSLSRHFYDLVQKILKLAVGDKNPWDKYLVIQLDDADSQMEKVYEVLEDVRKYLMIPNLVILMSVDQKCMSDVVFQDNLRCFPDLIKIDTDRLSRDLSRIANKYIDKLIPPTHMIQLPQLDQVVIQWGDMLRLQYTDEKDKHVYEWMNDKDLDFQTAILMLIYRKTGILFVKPGHYLHNIVPRTLRGFVQLLSLLDSMPDIPKLEFSDVVAYAESIQGQSEILAINQRRFTEYFKKSWLNVKITNLQDLDFLRKLADTASANRIRLVVKYLCKRYDVRLVRAVCGREDLDQLMWELDQVNRTEDHFRLMFAIRTLFTLDSHQHILKLKRETARAYQIDPKENKVLMFDLQPDNIKAPRKLVIDEAASECKIEENKIAVYAELLTPLLECNRFLEKENELITKETKIFKLQEILHTMQELAVMLYANCDASYTVRKSLRSHVNSAEFMHTSVTASAAADKLMSALLDLVSSFNDGKLQLPFANLEKNSNRYTSVLNVLVSFITDDSNKSANQQSSDANISQKQKTAEGTKAESDDMWENTVAEEQ